MSSRFKKAHKTHALAQPAGVSYPHIGQDGLLDIEADSADGRLIRRFQTLCALVPDAPMALYVQQSHVTHYQAVVNAAELQERIAVFSDNWSHWIDGAQGVTLNLLTGLAGGGSGSVIH